jgi:hypothetical protein
MRRVCAVLAVLAIIAIAESGVFAGTSGSWPLEQVVDQKVSIPGLGEYSLRDVFMDITVGSVSYQLPDGGLSSFAMASPGLAKGAALAYFEKERLRAYENQERAMESGTESERAYYRGVIERLEAARVWISTGDGSQLRAVLKRREDDGQAREKAEVPSTVDKATGNIAATGVFKGEPGVSYRDKTISLVLGLDAHGTPQCRGTGYIKLLDGSGGWVDYFITLEPGTPDERDTGKTFKVFPATYRWKGIATLEIRYGSGSRTERCEWVAEVRNQAVTGEVRGHYNEFKHMAASWIIDMIPDPLQFEAHFYDPVDLGG